MSSSKPETHISLTDTPDDVKRKIHRAYAPIGQTEGNPIVELVEHIILPWAGEIIIQRDEKYGGTVRYTRAEDFKKDYAERKLHPADVKPAVADALITLIRSANEA